ncbi:MAG: Mpo1-like protein [Myxococcota bacterium]
MALMKLNSEWSDLMQRYADDHQHPFNKTCHKIGVPMIAASLPVGATVVGLPLAAGLFTTGWALNFLGHAVEGKKPAFTEDRRQLLTGLLWWTHEVGLSVVEPKSLSAN